MTKKEIIIKTWMDLNIKTPFGICDKTGWVHGYFCNGVDDIINDYGDITDKIDYEIEYGGVGKFRPKSLQGIENNNGWVKIESEEDLPKNNGSYFTKTNYCKETIERYYPIFTKSTSIEDERKWWLENITHYQPIVKPNNPLY